MTIPPSDPSDQFVERAQSQMGAIEELFKGLPGIRDYVDKEMRRDADKRLRGVLADRIEDASQELLELQSQMLRSGGLASMDDVARVVTKLQTLGDRIRTASYGYAGLFDAVRIREDELRALYQFDVAMAARISEIDEEIDALETVVGGGGPVSDAVMQLANTVNELDRLYSKREDAIFSPDLLLDAANVPEVDTALLEAADRAAGSVDDVIVADEGMAPTDAEDDPAASA